MLKNVENRARIRYEWIEFFHLKKTIQTSTKRTLIVMYCTVSKISCNFMGNIISQKGCADGAHGILDRRTVFDDRYVRKFFI